jgi:hypothetical protein
MALPSLVILAEIAAVSGQAGDIREVSTPRVFKWASVDVR